MRAMSLQAKRDYSMYVGHIRLSRELIDSALWSDDALFSIFIKLIFRANYKPQEVIYKNKLYSIGRGELSTSWRCLATFLKIPVNSCRRIVKKLERFGYIELKSDTLQTTIKINNYDTLCAQGDESWYASGYASGYADEHASGYASGYASGQQLKNLRIKELKNERRGKAYASLSPLAESFLNSYANEMKSRYGREVTITTRMKNLAEKIVLEAKDKTEALPIVWVASENKWHMKRAHSLAALYDDLESVLLFCK